MIQSLCLFLLSWGWVALFEQIPSCRRLISRRVSSPFLPSVFFLYSYGLVVGSLHPDDSVPRLFLEDDAESTTTGDQELEALLLCRCNGWLILLQVGIQVGVRCNDVVDRDIGLGVALLGQPVQAI